MASTSLSSLAIPCTDSKSQRSFPMERQPRMLKDFLSSDELNSCSSNGFKSSPCQSTVRNLLEFDLEAKNNVAESKLLRSRSRAASTTISAVHKASEIVINAVKSSSVLPRSISWRLLRREFWNNKCKNDDVGVISATVKVKDILRWRSFRDLIEEKPPPLDFDFSSSSPCRCTTLTGSTSTDSSSNSSSWCESNFTAKYLPWWTDEDVAGDEVDVGKKFLPDYDVGGDSMKATPGETTAHPKGELVLEEKEQNSPVSVHDFPFEEDDEVLFPSLHQSLANMERRKCMLMKKIQESESLGEIEPVNLENQLFDEENACSEEEEEETYGSEEEAKQLLNHVKATLSRTETSDTNVDCLLLDFFRHELASRNQKDDEFDSEMVRVAKAWMVGEYDHGLFDWEVDDKRMAYITHMEKGLRWSKFEKEQEELAMEMEIGVLTNIVDELLVDVFACCRQTSKFNRKLFSR